MRPTFASLAVVVAVTLAGCGPKQQPEFNPTPTTGEADVLVEPIQLTRGFAKAGEAYFSPDMKWVIFQGAMKMEDDYLMYLAQLKWEKQIPPGAQDPKTGANLTSTWVDQITGINTPICISPSPSWNSCGFFSPDGNSIVFSSTALHAVAREEAGGYQRGKGGYRWSMPPTAEVFRADGWQGAVAALPPGGSTNLAKFPITENAVHDAECSYSPDGKWIVYTSMVDDLPLMPPPTPEGEMIRRKGEAAATAPSTRPAASAALPNLELFVMRPDGSRKTRLTRVAGYDGGAFFSPDGKRLVYRSDRVGNNFLQVYTADIVRDANGDVTGLTNERQLTHDVNVNWGPYWHPDRHHLIYATSIHGHANYELYLMRDDGSHKTRVTFTQGADLLPVFSPDGKWLMWTSQRGPERQPDPRNPGQTRGVSEIWIARFRLPTGS